MSCDAARASASAGRATATRPLPPSACSRFPISCPWRWTCSSRPGSLLGPAWPLLRAASHPVHCA